MSENDIDIPSDKQIDDGEVDIVQELERCIYMFHEQSNY